MIQQIYESGTGGVNDELLKRYAGGFDKAVMAVFGGGKQHPELERELRINAGRFGTFKTYDLCSQLQKAREAGMSLDEFKEFATGHIGVFNSYQKTEYNTLVARARTAKQWEAFRDDRELYPNIEWLRTSSTHPRPEHLAYDGLVLPMDDPFWTDNQPGNEYNCKCDWRTTDKPTTDRPNEKQTYKPAAGLEGNPAQTGELVTERHPYFRRNRQTPGWVENKALLQLPDEVAFLEKTTAAGGKYWEHLLVGKAEEAIENRAIASLLVEKGYKKVTLLPQIYKNESALRQRYFGSEYVRLHPTSNPDALVNGSFVEFKTCGRHNASKRILEAAKKSNRVLLKMNEPVSEYELKTFINRQWSMSDRKNMNELIIYANGKLETFIRP